MMAFKWLRTASRLSRGGVWAGASHSTPANAKIAIMMDSCLVRSRILTAARQRIDRQLRNARGVLDSFGHLTRDPLGERGLCSKRSRRGGIRGPLGGRLSKGEQIDDVHLGERRFGSVGGLELRHRPREMNGDVVLLDGGFHEKIHHRFRANRIGKGHGTAIDLEALVEKKHFTAV